MRLKEAKGPARPITGWAFILWGLHKADYPFLRPFGWIAPFGYILGAALGFISAIGIILLYLEKTKRELGASEQKYRSMFENAAEGIFQTTSDGRFLRANPALVRMFGYESAEQLMESVTSLGTQVYVEAGDRKRLLALIGEHGVVERFETQFRRKDGETLWVSINVRAVKDASGEIGFYEGSVEDVTDRKQSERELRISRLHLAEAADLAKIAYWEQDETSDEFIFNDAFYSLYATTADREGGYRMARDEYVRRFVHPDDMEELTREIEENRTLRAADYPRNTSTVQSAGMVK